MEELFPKMGNKWSTTIGDDIIRQPMEAHNIAKIRFIVPKLEMALKHGIKCTILVNRSTTIKMEPCPLESGKSGMKSIEVSGSCRSSPYGR